MYTGFLILDFSSTVIVLCWVFIFSLINVFSHYRYMHRWELDAALDVLTMCHCHLPESDPSKKEVSTLVFLLTTHDI